MAKDAGIHSSLPPSLSEDNWQFGPVAKGSVQTNWLYVHHLDGNRILIGCVYSTDSSIRNECWWGYLCSGWLLLMLFVIKSTVSCTEDEFWRIVLTTYELSHLNRKDNHHTISSQTTLSQNSGSLNLSEVSIKRSLKIAFEKSELKCAWHTSSSQSEGHRPEPEISSFLTVR